MSTTDYTSFLSDDFNDNKLDEFDHVGGKRLQITNQIGRTQLAAVFQAWDRNVGREVAVKVIECRSEANDTFQKAANRIRREVKAWADVENKSPFILPLTDVMCHRVITPDHGFIVFILIMPFAPLGDLKKYIKEKCPNGLDLSVTQLRAFLLQIAEALEAVHASASIHKDIKSSNVLLFPGRIDSSGKQCLIPKLADFGITQKVLDDSHGVEGTPEYMAPEAFVSKGDQKYTPAFPSDIYSLGVLFYEAITGHRPYVSSVLSPTEKFTAYETLHKSGNINFSGVEARMGEEMALLVKDMLSVDPQKRPDIRAVVSEINSQIVIAQHGEITAQGTRSIPSSIYRWNPFVHENLGDHLSYYFLKGQNSNNDPLWICDTLSKKDIHGFSLYRVIGGIDLLLRIWEGPGARTKAIEEVLEDFKRLQNGHAMQFKVEGFHSLSSKPAISFTRLDKENIPKLIFECLKENRDEEDAALSTAGITIGRLAFDETKENFPLRVFVGFRIDERSANTTSKRIFGREIYETLMPFQKNEKLASISVYWGVGTYSFLVKLRLKKFEDYELIWDECLKSFSSVHEGVIVQSDTYLELNRVSFHESDDGNIWKEVDKYRADHRLTWPGALTRATR